MDGTGTLHPIFYNYPYYRKCSHGDSIVLPLITLGDGGGNNGVEFKEFLFDILEEIALSFPISPLGLIY